MFLYPHHITYAVYSIREMAEYLETNFGMKPWRVDQHPHMGLRTVMYMCDKTILEFSEPFIDEKGEVQVDAAACKLFANLLRETGPGLFHVAWAVNGIDGVYKDLRAKGNKMDGQGHEDQGPLHDSLHPFYKVFNVVPTSIGPTYENSVRGVFFQLAEGKPGPEHLANKGNLDITTLPKRYGGNPKAVLQRNLGNVVAR